MSDRPALSTWRLALLALRLVTVDPGLGGIVLRARAGPVREAFLVALAEALPGARKIHPGIDDEQLFGGIDLTATLTSGQMTRRAGLADAGAPLVLSMAERAPPALAARLALLLDRPDAPVLIALDEGAEPDEAVPDALAARLAFHVDLEGLSLADVHAGLVPTGGCGLATASTAQIAQIVRLALTFGVDSPRAACLTLRAAQAHAGLFGRGEVEDADVEAAVMLVLVPRATQIPNPEEKEHPEETPPETPGDDDAPSRDPEISDDMLIEAAKAMIPADLLDRLAARTLRQGKGAGAGGKRTGNRRGRPLPSRPGTPGSQARIDIVATLRQAAPWQKLRRQVQPERTGVLVRPSDIHIKRAEVRSDQLLIFAVDASGSAAVSRLAEAKGAVELMLAAAYMRRDHVALVAFRRTAAEVLLQPTRSLVRTKRELAALPGGGGTPLAAGLEAAMVLARAAQGRGMTPTIALLTDGRANVALDGSPGRDQAGADAERLATALRLQGVGAVVIDMGNRPEPALAQLARLMDAPYLALPRADAKRISTAVSAALEA